MLAVDLGECRAGAGAQRLPRAGAQLTRRSLKSRSLRVALGQTPIRVPRMSRTETSGSQHPPLAGVLVEGRTGRAISRR